MKNKFKKVFRSLTWWLGVVVVGVFLGLTLQFVRAWTEPSQSPPGGNVGAPINTGPFTQTKHGGDICVDPDNNPDTPAICLGSIGSGGGGELGIIWASRRSFGSECPNGWIAVGSWAHSEQICPGDAACGWDYTTNRETCVLVGNSEDYLIYLETKI